MTQLQAGRATTDTDGSADMSADMSTAGLKESLPQTVTLDPGLVRTLRDLVREHERLQGGHPCLVFESTEGRVTSWTYAEFATLVRRAAAGFARLGVRKGDAVVIHLSNRPEFMLSWFGLAWLGAVMVPSNTANTERELAHLFDLSEAVGYVTSDEHSALLGRVAAGRTDTVFAVLAGDSAQAGRAYSFEDLLDAGDDPPEDPLDETDVVELLFTSGTTSAPKAVMITHANCVRAGVRKVLYYEFGPQDRLLTALPAFHANAQTTTILAALVAGATCVLLETYSASRYWSQIRHYRATSTNLVAMQVRTLLAQPPQDTDRDHQLRCNFYAINVLDSEKHDFEERFGLRLMNGWGMSETFCVVTRTPLRGDDRWPSVGIPVHDRLIRIVDADGRDVPVGTIGEIVVGGVPGISYMSGYFKDPEATAQTIRSGWLFTGDNGYVDRDGYLYFFDRKKDMIKRAGENISASEVEAVLLTHPRVEECAVIGVPDPVRDEAVKAFVVLTPGPPVEESELQAHCLAQLSSFKIPTVFQIVPSLPRTSVGKVEKKLLRGWEAPDGD